MIDRKRFFASITPTPLARPLRQSQVTTLDAMITEYERREWTDLRWLAYMMGTVLRECGRPMAPVREGFAKTDAAARAYVKRKGYRYAKVVNGNVYYGRGLVQVTWIENCKALTDLAHAQGFDVDFVANPDLLLEPKWAVWAMFEGMSRGTFTKKKLSDYFNDRTADWMNARRIINGLDHAAEVAGNGKMFFADLIAANG